MSKADATQSKAPDAVGLTWRDKLFALRDQLYADQRFQRWAATFPLTRRVAQKRAGAAFDLCAGFVYSQVLGACIELEILEQLALQPQVTADLARRAAMPDSSMERLLAAAAALRLVSRRSGGRWGLGSVGAAIRGNPGLADMIRHHGMLYADLADPVALLRGRVDDTRLARFWPYASASGGVAISSSQVADYSRLMARSQAMIARDIIDAYPLGQHSSLLDVGGGEGAFLSAVAARHQGLRLALFDLPAVAERARAVLEASGLAGRAIAHGGDFFADVLPVGADVISLVRILHDHDDDRALVLLRNIRRALPAGGTLLLAEPMSATRGAEAVGDAYFGFYLLAMGSGRPRTPGELQAMLRVAGFSRSRLLRTARPMLVQAIAAQA